MKKLLVWFVFLLFTFILSSCETDVLDEIQDQLPITVDVTEMVQVLRSGRNNFTPNMESMRAKVESGDTLDASDLRVDDPSCTYAYDYIDNEDGTYTTRYTYYEYNYDYYNRAYEMLYNGIDDDNDGLIDEEDELLLMVTETMIDGIDNNYNGIIDEYFEMEPSYVVTYTITYGDVSTTTVTEDGTITTIGSSSYTWSEVKTPYTGQVIDSYACYQEDTDDNDEDIINDDTYNDLYTIYVALVNEISTLSNTYDYEAYGILYLELSLGRSLTDVELAAMNLVWDLYEFIPVTTLTDVEYQVLYLEYYLNRMLTEDELRALEFVYQNRYYDDALTDEEFRFIEIVEVLYEQFYENYDANDYERFNLAVSLGRPLTTEENSALEIVYEIRTQQASSLNLDALISLYERILNRALTEDEQLALNYFEVGYYE
jgi:hypothetical protein